MSKPCVLILSDKYYSDSIKKIYEKILNCNIRTISNVDLTSDDSDICFQLKCILNQYNEGMKYGCNIILDNNEMNKLPYYKSNNYKYYSLDGNIFKDYKVIKKINPKVKFLYYLRYKMHIKLITFLLRNTQLYIRKNIGFEINEGSFERIENALNKHIANNNNVINILKYYFYYKTKLKNVYLDKPKNCLKVGIISNKYIPVELYYNYFIEKEFSNNNIEVSRNIEYNYKESKLKIKYYLFKLRQYCKYNIGFRELRSLYRTNNFIKRNYDSIIFIKTSNCLQDINTSIIIKKMCSNNDIPFMVIDFNENITELKLKNDINAFYDMMRIIKNNNKKG